MSILSRIQSVSTQINAVAERVLREEDDFTDPALTAVGKTFLKGRIKTKLEAARTDLDGIITDLS